MYACKLDLKLDVSQINENDIKKVNEFDKVQKYSNNLAGTHVAMHNFEVIDVDHFLLQLPQKLLSLESPRVAFLKIPASNVSDPVIAAHVDLPYRNESRAYRRRCVINFFYNWSSEVVNFYKWDRELKQSLLVETCTPSQNECWLMNTSVPHSANLIPNKEASILSFAFEKLCYEEVLNVFS